MCFLNSCDTPRAVVLFAVELFGVCVLDYDGPAVRGQNMGEVIAAAAKK